MRARISDGSDPNQNLVRISNAYGSGFGMVRIRAVRTKNRFGPGRPVGRLVVSRRTGRSGLVWSGLVSSLVGSGRVVVTSVSGFWTRSISASLSVGAVLVLDTHVQAPSAHTQANGSEMARAFTRRISMVAVGEVGS